MKDKKGSSNALYYSGDRAFIDEESGVLVKPGNNQIADAKTAKAIAARHAACTLGEMDDDESDDEEPEGDDADA